MSSLLISWLHVSLVILQRSLHPVPLKESKCLCHACLNVSGLDVSRKVLCDFHGSNCLLNPSSHQNRCCSRRQLQPLTGQCPREKRACFDWVQQHPCLVVFHWLCAHNLAWSCQMLSQVNVSTRLCRAGELRGICILKVSGHGPVTSKLLSYFRIKVWGTAAVSIYHCQIPIEIHKQGSCQCYTTASRSFSALPSCTAGEHWALLVGFRVSHVLLALFSSWLMIHRSL